MLRAYMAVVRGKTFIRAALLLLPAFTIFVDMAMDGETVDLYELQAALREGIEELFPEGIWVRAEIASVQVKAKGHCYLELCRNAGGKVVAKARAVIWRSTYIPLMHYFREATGGGLAPGMEVLARVQVSYSELYGLSLTVSELEPEYSLGAAERQRRETVARLEAEGLMDRQKCIESPALPYRLAVISARDAAGFGDFKRHLEENRYGFSFEVELFEAAMQGPLAPASVTDALAAVESSERPFDAALILRGGGSALDLACFDDYGLCVGIAVCSVPVYTAIGHDRDCHVADMVAHGFVKTPTALADEFIGILAEEDGRLSSYGNRLKLAFGAKVSALESALNIIEARIAGADPRRVLSRGYALVSDWRGVVLKGVSALDAGSKIRVMFEDGEAVASVEKIMKKQ